jgi:type VI secretion system secreted protein Hcp
MKIEGIKGDATAQGHKEQIQLSSFQVGAGLAVGSPVGGSKDRVNSSVSISEITVSKNFDIATPDTFKRLCAGTSMDKVEIFFTVATGKEAAGNDNFLTYTLENVVFSGQSFSSGGDRPSETLSLNFTKITIKLLTADATGKLTAVAPEVGWDLSANAAV